MESGHKTVCKFIFRIKTMRIARIIEYFPPHSGGMERHGLILSQEQAKLGHDVEIFIGVGDTSLFPKTKKAPFQFLPLYSKVRRLWFNLWAYFATKNHNKKDPYDVIHLHGDFIEAFFGGKLSQKIKIPAIITIHGGLNKRLLKPKNAEYFKNIAKIICVSQDVAEELKTLGIPTDKIVIISSGVNLSGFNEVKEENVVAIKNQYSHPIIISVGVLRINKGFNFLINAFKKIVDVFPKATLLIIGDGPERDKLKQLTKGVSGITFLGEISHDDVVKYLKAADVFVLASVSTSGDREGTPTSIMEAMVAGLPIVSTRVGGIPSLIKDGVNGLLVEEKNINALADAITKLIQDKELAARMGRQNLEDIKQKDWPIITRSVTNEYLN